MLDREILKNEILKINDSSSDGFEGWPTSCSSAAERWAKAIYTYGKDLTPTSTTFDLARAGSEGVFLQICSAGSMQASAVIFANAIKTFAEYSIMGMTPIWNGVMPPAPLILLPIFVRGVEGASAYDFANDLSIIVHDWFKTGTAINNNSGVTINWS